MSFTSTDILEAAVDFLEEKSTYAKECDRADYYSSHMVPTLRMDQSEQRFKQHLDRYIFERLIDLGIHVPNPPED